MASIGKMDDLVKEYLLYRGLTSTLKSLELEIRIDKDKGFRVDKIMDQLTTLACTYDLNNLRDYWNYLDQRIFSRLEQVYASSVRKLEVSLLKYYVVNAIQNNRTDKVTEFFEKMTTELQHQAEWKDWFVLPFIRSPEENPVFSVYFTRQWQETFLISLHNFLSVIFQSMPVPPLLNYEEDQKRLARLMEENEAYKKQLKELQENRNAEIVFPSCRPETDSLSPSHSTPGVSVDLMDDFYVISQDTTLVPEQQDQPKTNQIRSFIKNIGLPSSPIMSKKSPSSATSAQNSKHSNSAASGIKDDPTNLKGTTNKDTSIPTQKTKLTKTSSAKGCTSSAPSNGQLGMSTWPPGGSSQKHKPNTDECESKDSQASSSVPVKVKSTDSQKNAQEELPGEGSARKDVPSSFPSYKKPAEALPVESYDEQSPFLLLSQEEYSEHRSSVTHCRFSTNGNAVATSDIDGVVKVWTLQPSPVTMATVMSKSMLLSLEWASKTDRLILLGNRAGSVRLFDIKEKKTVKEASVDASYPRIISLCCNPSGTSFVCSAAGKMKPLTGAGDANLSNIRLGKVTLWDMKTMKIEKQLSLSPNPVATNCMCFNHNGQLLLTGAADGVISLFDMQKAECISTWQAHNGEVYSVQFSADETSCFSMGSDGKFVQWSMQRSGSQLFDLDIHAGACGPFVLSGAGGYRQVQTPKGRLFAFDAEGNHVLTCSQNGGLVYKMDRERGLVKVLSLGGHQTPVTSVDWSYTIDCKMCLTGSMDGKVRVSTLLPK